MKTPPSNLPPIPEGFTYIGVDDGSLIEEGCLHERICAFKESRWRSGYCDGSPPCGLPIAAPTGSRLHTLNSVPATNESAAARMLLDAFAEQVKTLKEERNELLEIRDMMTQQINSLRTELANLKAEIKNRGAGWDVAANLRDEVKRLKRAGDMAATSYNEARIERDDAVQELARVRETLRTFYAAAEAMKAEVAK